MGRNAKRNHVFVSYSHKDQKWLNRLQVHLRPLTRDYKIDLWDDTRIQSGSNWRNEIEKAIDKANVAVLLISADFLASDFINENELPPLLEKAQNKGAIIYSVIISPCRFMESEELSKFQAVNAPSSPLTSQSVTKREKVFVELSKSIENAFPETKPTDVETKIKNLSFEKKVIDENSQSSEIIDNSKELTPNPAVLTGFHDLDDFILGLQPSELVIAAARPNMGLSAFAQNIALNSAVLENRRVGLFSMKSTKEKIVSQILSSEARVDLHRFLSGHLIKAEWRRLEQALETLKESAIFTDDTFDLSIDKIQVKLKRTLASENKLDLVIVDDLQHLVASQKKAVGNSDISQLTYELKGLAKEFGIPVVVVYQLPAISEPYSYQNRPTLLEISDSIKQFVDVMILIHREDFYRPTEENAGIAEIKVTKNDNGTARTFKLAFLKEFNRFENYFSQTEADSNS